MRRLKWYQRVLRAAYFRYVLADYFPLYASFGRQPAPKRTLLPAPYLVLEFSINPPISGARTSEVEGVLFAMALTDEQVRVMVDGAQQLMAADA